MAKRRVSAKTRRRLDEQIVEFSGADGTGGLIAIRQMADGRVLVELYRLDADVVVRVPAKNLITD